ncbi:hypothetical protein [Streptomyces sp. WAC06614]|uniref:hypothetical protein n=1 Tax=Streptomyces sp. WAC06614 TaxID=2487416 RepID=UPI000F7BA6E5|nr:hypothetical protein [Streptomyces sp. WAC06614]RSS81114.1 hypothetical protein EF918_11335 [Streptomyces sp. WAC06614]
MAKALVVGHGISKGFFAGEADVPVPGGTTLRFAGNPKEYVPKVAIAAALLGKDEAKWFPQVVRGGRGVYCDNYRLGGEGGLAGAVLHNLEESAKAAGFTLYVVGSGPLAGVTSYCSNTDRCKRRGSHGRSWCKGVLAKVREEEVYLLNCRAVEAEMLADRILKRQRVRMTNASERVKEIDKAASSIRRSGRPQDALAQMANFSTKDPVELWGLTSQSDTSEAHARLTAIDKKSKYPLVRRAPETAVKQGSDLKIDVSQIPLPRRFSEVSPGPWAPAFLYWMQNSDTSLIQYHLVLFFESDEYYRFFIRPVTGGNRQGRGSRSSNGSVTHSSGSASWMSISPRTC